MTRLQLLRAHAVATRVDMMRSGFARDVSPELAGASASTALLVFLFAYGLAVGVGSLFVR